MSRIHNFSAGPAVLPVPVLEQAREALLDFNGSGMGIMECSHRSGLFQKVIDDAKARLRRVLSLTDDQEVLFLPGGASTQFFQIPMNLMRGGRAAYLDTGVWAGKAIAEAKRFGHVDVPFSSKADGWNRVAAQGEWGELDPDTVYLHYTSNNTVAGTQFPYVPEVRGPWLVCDMSSDIASRPIEGSKFDLIYAGAQKNLGPSGVTVVVIRRALLEKCDPDLPTMLRYAVHVEQGSLYNTPNTWGIYVVERVCAWIEDGPGGLAGVAERNQRRADAVYAAIDGSDGFYQGRALSGSRSVMNVTFTTGDADQDTAFHQGAAKEGISGLKGHKSIGGLRASLYNAQTDDAVDALLDWMGRFKASRG